MKRLIEDRNNTETVARAWVVIEPILAEQQRILVSKNDDECNHHKLNGLVQGYKALEAFKDAGEESINASRQAVSNNS